MTIEEQIKVVKDLIEATKELNNEYQDGWDSVIEEAKRLLEYLKYNK